MFDLDKVTTVQNDILVLKKNKDQDNFLHEVVESIAQTLKVYFVGIYLLDQSKEYIVLRSGSGNIGKRLLTRGHKIRIAAKNPYMGQVSTAAYHGQVKTVDWLGDKISTYQVLGTDVLETEPETISNEYFRSPMLPESRIELYLPLQLAGRTIGVLELTFDKQLKFGPDEISKLQRLANELAIAIC